MNFRSFLVSILFFHTGLISAQTTWTAESIPHELKEKANAVVRKRDVKFEILAENRATYSSHEVITILNAKGGEHAIQWVFYDKLIRVASLKAIVYDKNGVLVKKLKPADFKDQSAISGFSLYEDNRVKIADLSNGNYPYTIEFEYSLDFRYLFHIPSFYPISDENLSIEGSSFKLVYPPDNSPRFLERNLTDALMNKKISETSILWEFGNLKPIEMERNGPYATEVLPSILSAPTQFQYEGYNGRMDTWENFGVWINSLNKDRDELTPETKKKVQELISGLNTIEEKSKILYEFLQSRTRYVSIQLGIGGFQPIDSKTVDQVGYGDCKALSNYMLALLKEAGIEGNYNLIKAGSNIDPIETSFPSTQFNHVIVSIPMATDTLWLECTSQTNPFNYLGSFTGDRMALSITKSGATIVKTPGFTNQNFQIRNAIAHLDEHGTAEVLTTTKYSGSMFERNGLNYTIHSTDDKKKEWIEQNTSVPSFHLMKFNINGSGDSNPKAVVDVTYNIDQLANVSGKRVFITPNVFNKMPLKFSGPSNRVYDIIIRNETVEIDSIEFRIPPNLYPEFVPEKKNIQNQFGEYEANVFVREGLVLYTRKLIIKKGRYPANSFTDLNSFNKEIIRHDNVKIAFLSKT